MNCIKCRKAELDKQVADLPAEVKGESVLVTRFPSLVCPECGYKTIQGHDMQEFMRVASDIYRRKHALLTSTEIRERRENLKYSQKEFANHLGVGIASIKRWELGQIQDPAMDRLIRVSTDLNEAYENYKRVEQLVQRHNQRFWAPSTQTQSWHGNHMEMVWEKISHPQKNAGRHRPVPSS